VRNYITRILPIPPVGSSGESAHLWERTLVEMAHRGLKKVLLFVGDGQRGFEEAANRALPES